MSLSKLLMADKQPLLISAALTIFGWYIGNIVSYFQNSDIVHINTIIGNTEDQYIVKNISLTRSLERYVFFVTCLNTSECLQARDHFGEKRYGSIQEIAPFADANNQICSQSSRSYYAVISLAPGAIVNFSVNKAAKSTTQIFVKGKSKEGCGSNVDPANVRVELGHSLLAFFLGNFLSYYLISMAVLAIVFFVSLWRMVLDSGAREQTNEERNLNVAVTLRRSD